jgi:hypothetical protein
VNLVNNKTYFAFCDGEFCYFKNCLHEGEGVFKLYNFIRKRYDIKTNLPKNEFIILNELPFYTCLPNSSLNYNFNVKIGLKDYSTSLLCNKIQEKISIKTKNYIITNDGILLYWIFVSNYDFNEFENEVFNNISVEIKLQDKTIKTQGEKYFIHGVKSKIDFSIKII